MAAGHPQDGRRTGAGRPRIIKSVKHFEAIAGAYFYNCEVNDKPILLTGLILALGLSSRAALDEYEKRQEFFNSVKRAKLRIEMEYEKRLLDKNPTGAIFALKNFGWTDKQQVDADIKAEVKDLTLLDIMLKAGERLKSKAQQDNDEQDEDEPYEDER